MNNPTTPTDRARELLADEFRKDGFDLVAESIEEGCLPGGHPGVYFRAIARALSHADAVEGGPLSGKYGDVLRPFLSMMNTELHANAGKGDRPGWLGMDRKTALLELYYHLSKLQKAMKDDNADGIREYAADVANMAMMAVDVCGLLDTTPPPAPAAVAGGGKPKVYQWQIDSLRYGLRLKQDDEQIRQAIIAASVAAQPAAGEVVRPTDDALWDKTLRDRDRYHDTADELAACIATITGQHIGEHSSGNCPWQNAIDAAAEYVTATQRPSVVDEPVIGDEVDLSRGEGHKHPDIVVGAHYLAKIGGFWWLGKFSQQWYGLNFGPWANGVGTQFDVPGTNGSTWERLVRIDLPQPASDAALRPESGSQP